MDSLEAATMAETFPNLTSEAAAFASEDMVYRMLGHYHQNAPKDIVSFADTLAKKNKPTRAPTPAAPAKLDPKHIVCPVLAAMVRAGHLKPDKYGSVEIEDLFDGDTKFCFSPKTRNKRQHGTPNTYCIRFLSFPAL